MITDYGVRPVRSKKRWTKIFMLLLLILCIVVGYQTVYKSRAAIKNYASYAAICVIGVENNLEDFETANLEKREQILQSMPNLWQIFCEIECPDNPRTFEIEWKMAKLLEYTRIFFEQEIMDVYMGTEKDEALCEIRERIIDLKWLIDDTMAYGNFKRLQ